MIFFLLRSALGRERRDVQLVVESDELGAAIHIQDGRLDVFDVLALLKKKLVL